MTYKEFKRQLRRTRWRFAWRIDDEGKIRARDKYETPHTRLHDPITAVTRLLNQGRFTPDQYYEAAAVLGLRFNWELTAIATDNCNFMFDTAIARRRKELLRILDLSEHEGEE